tara:strand:+ start:4848 stop:5015 length:168 start_codon:yes stop_codon:yes gene_type:complete
VTGGVLSLLKIICNFSIDYPFVENQPGRDWAEQLNLSLEDRRKLLNGNVRKLLKL